MTQSHSPSRLQVETSGFVNTEGAERTGEMIGFSFGANWAKFLREMSEKTVSQAVRDYFTFSKRDSLRGQTLLNIGSGSGLGSLVAYGLGAERVVSVDLDPNSVACTSSLRARFAADADHWDVHQGSMRDGGEATGNRHAN